MQVFEHNDAGRLADSSVVTIGNFDGLHLGHQALIQRCIAQRDGKRIAAMVTFEPLPAAFFRPEAPPARLYGPGERIALARKAGMDLVWMMRFNRQLAETPAAEFAQRVLKDSLGAERVVVGEDFRFGKDRLGNTGLLEEMGIAVEVVPLVSVDGRRVSSSRIRQALAQGDFAAAGELLGRPYRMSGRVIGGERLGRNLGYPTANIVPGGLPSPLSGIYATRTRIQGRQDWLDGVASLGRRPTVGGKEFLLEVHLFDFEGDLYGQELEVEFVGAIRGEEQFDSLDALVAQMKNDETKARAILAQA